MVQREGSALAVGAGGGGTGLAQSLAVSRLGAL